MADETELLKKFIGLHVAALFFGTAAFFLSGPIEGIITFILSMVFLIYLFYRVHVKRLEQEGEVE